MERVDLNRTNEMARALVETLKTFGDRGAPVEHNRIMPLIIDKAKLFDFHSEQSPEMSKRIANGIPEDRQRLVKEKAIKIKVSTYYISAIAQIKLDALKLGFGFAVSKGQIYAYNRAYWLPVGDDFAQKLSEYAIRLGVPSNVASDHKFIKELGDQALSQFERFPEKGLDVLINLQNGTYRIDQKGELTFGRHQKEDYLTYILPYEYDQEATCERFKTFIDRVIPNKANKQVIQEYLGYLFIRNGTGRIRSEKVLFMLGGGSNGKSTLTDVIRALLGTDNCSTASLTTLTDIRTGDNARLQLKDKIVNFSSEIGRDINPEMFKVLASGEPVQAKKLYQDSTSITNYAKLIVSANEMPRPGEFNEGFFRRFLIVPFEVTITAGEKDENLTSKIIETDLPGIFNWVLEGLRRVIKRGGLMQSSISDNYVERYRSDYDTALMYCNEMGFSVGNDQKQELAAVYDSYRSHCNDGGQKPLSKNNFSKRLKQLGYTVQKGTNNKTFVWYNLAPSIEEEAPGDAEKAKLFDEFLSSFKPGEAIYYGEAELAYGGIYGREVDRGHLGVLVEAKGYHLSDE